MRRSRLFPPGAIVRATGMVAMTSRTIARCFGLFFCLALAFTSHAQTWTGSDIGAVAAAGSHSVSGTTYTIRASGNDIWNKADEFYFVYTTLAGDGEIT